MHERIKKLRKELNLTQQEFATRLNIGRGTLANYEVGRNEPIDAVINLICREFNVNETWLRTGEGEMFVQLPKNEALEQQIREFLKGENDSFRERLVSLLLRLPPEHWETLERYAQELVEARSAPAFAPAPEPDYEAEARAEAEEYYRQRLMEKGAEDASSASSGFGRKKA